MAGTVTIKYSYGQVLANVEASEVTVGFLNGKNGEDATLPANLAYTNVENVFTKKQTVEGQQIPLQFRYVKSGETILSLFSSSIEALGNEAFTEIQLYRNGSFKNKLSIFETFISSTGKDLGTTLLRFKELFLSSYANVLGVKSVENDATKVFATDGSVVSITKELGFALGDETSDIIVGTDVLTFQMPNYATTLLGVSVNVKTAPTGSSAIFDLNENGVSVLSTKISIDVSEKTSEDSATPPVISDATIAANAIMTMDIDQIGSTIAGVAPKAWIYYKRT